MPTGIGVQEQLGEKEELKNLELNGYRLKFLHTHRKYHTVISKTNLMH